MILKVRCCLRMFALLALAVSATTSVVANSREIVPVQVLGEHWARAVEFLSKNYDASAGVFHNACVSTGVHYYLVILGGVDTAYLFIVSDEQFVENVAELAMHGGEFAIGETMGGEATRVGEQETARSLAGVPFVLSFSFEDVFKQAVTRSCLEPRAH